MSLVDVLYYLKTAFALVITLSVLVIAHELGHFIVAKLVGVRVEEFALGFGPKLIRLFKRGDTEYTIHPIPAGGFVKLSGMEPDDEEDPRGYNAQPIWKRFLIIFAGPFMSFFLGYVIFCSLGITIGLPDPARNVVGTVRSGSPADRVGLKSGDRLVAIGDTDISNGQQLQSIVFRSAGRELRVRVRRGDKTFVVKATPKETLLEGQKVGLLGVTLESSGKVRKYGVVGSIARGTDITREYLIATYHGLTRKSELKKVGGIVAITRVTAAGVKEGPAAIIIIMASLSLGFAVINLVPWPILDGGHILLLGLEIVRRKRLTTKQMGYFQAFGLVTIVALALFLVYADITKWIGKVPLGQ